MPAMSSRENTALGAGRNSNSGCFLLDHARERDLVVCAIKDVAGNVKSGIPSVTALFLGSLMRAVSEGEARASNRTLTSERKRRKDMTVDSLQKRARFVPSESRFGWAWQCCFAAFPAGLNSLRWTKKRRLHSLTHREQMLPPVGSKTLSNDREASAAKLLINPDSRLKGP